VLPREHRLGTAADFAAVIKAGRRAGASRLVVHVVVSDRSDAPRAGFVVSKKVGNSVVRHRVARRLRPLVVELLRRLEPGTAIVVRALPSAANATSAELGGDLRAGLASAGRKARSQQKSSGSIGMAADSGPPVAIAASMVGAKGRAR
jgi:ribonuclease P protein component